MISVSSYWLSKVKDIFKMAAKVTGYFFTHIHSTYITCSNHKSSVANFVYDQVSKCQANNATFKAITPCMGREIASLHTKY